MQMLSGLVQRGYNNLRHMMKIEYRVFGFFNVVYIKTHDDHLVKIADENAIN